MWLADGCDQCSRLCQLRQARSASTCGPNFPSRWALEKTSADLSIVFLALRTGSDFLTSPPPQTLFLINHSTKPDSLPSLQDISPEDPRRAMVAKIMGDSASVTFFKNHPKHEHYKPHLSENSVFNIRICHVLIEDYIRFDSCWELLQQLLLCFCLALVNSSAAGPLWQPGGVEETGRAAELLRLADRPPVWASAPRQTPSTPGAQTCTFT